MKKSIFSFLLKFCCLSFIFLTLTSLNAFAADPVAAPDLTTWLLALWSAIQNHASTALILVPIFQILKTHEVLGLLSGLPSKTFQIVISLITVAGFVVQAVANGQSVLQAVITGLFTAGGAMLIYDAFAGINAPATPVVASASK